MSRPELATALSAMRNIRQAAEEATIDFTTVYDESSYLRTARGRFLVEDFRSLALDDLYEKRQAIVEEVITAAIANLGDLSADA